MQGKVGVSGMMLTGMILSLIGACFWAIAIAFLTIAGINQEWVRIFLMFREIITFI